MEVHAQHQIHAAVVLAGLEQLALTVCFLNQFLFSISFLLYTQLDKK
jgi:hypothetical protein